MGVDADGHEADDVLVEAHLALHLLDGRRRGVDVHQRVIGLAVLVDAIGQGLQTPVLDLRDLAAASFQNATQVFDQLIDLLVRDILTRKEDVLVKSHIVSPFRFRFLS